MGWGMLDQTYGGPAPLQPTAAPVVAHRGQPEPMALTAPRPSTGGWDSPAVVIVALLAVAVIVTQVAFRGEVTIEV